jgi:serine/threonine-protein kinase
VIGVVGAAAVVFAARRRLFDAPVQAAPAPPPVASATPPAPTPQPPPPVATVAVASVAIAVSAAPEAPPSPAPRADVTSCAKSQFAAGTFADATPLDFSWMCAESDPRRGAATLKGLVVRAGGNGPVTEAMKEWALLHWYELAAFGVVRARCCAGASPLVLPAPIGRCAPLDRAIDDLAAASNGDADFSAPLAAFRGAVHCTIASGLVADYTYKDAPPAGAEGILEKLLARGVARRR